MVWAERCKLKKTDLFTVAEVGSEEAQIVSGKVIYDGSTYNQLLSYHDHYIDANFSTAVSNVKPTTTEYDEVGRAVKVTLPDGSTTALFSNKCFLMGAHDADHTNRCFGQNRAMQTDVKGRNLASIQNDLVTKFDINS
jgi:hypothetical protein